MSRSITLSLGLVAISLAACRWYGADPRVNRKVADSELVGRWVLSAESLEIAKRDGYVPAAGAPHEIVIRADGTCDVSTLFEGCGKIEYVRVHGPWSLAHDGGQPRRKNLLNLGLEPRFREVMLVEEHDQLLLSVYWMDADQWEFMKYAKQP
jgi:hypothetical protein